MDLQDFTQKIEDISRASRETQDPAKKAELADEFWKTAVEGFNEHIAGDITTVTGVTLHTPPIEL